MIDTSQYGEGRYIAQYFEYFAGRVGRFLDVGAFDGRTFSNSWPLSEVGWSGVCVEPSPPAFCQMMKNHEDHPNVHLVNVGIGPVSGLFRLHCNTPDGFAADALSSFEDSHRDRFAKAGFPFREIVTAKITWDELRYSCGVLGFDHFDLINIDTEGSNAETLRKMPYRPEMVCVEYDPDADGVNTVHNILTGWGYKITVIGGNVLGVRG